MTWLICFYAAWSPSSINFAPTFAKLSSQYHLPNLKFGKAQRSISQMFTQINFEIYSGKIDVGRYPEAAEKNYINASALTRQLPTVILFQDGKEVLYFPNTFSNRCIIKFKFAFPRPAARPPSSPARSKSSSSRRRRWSTSSTWTTCTQSARRTRGSRSVETHAAFPHLKHKKNVFAHIWYFQKIMWSIKDFL